MFLLMEQCISGQFICLFDCFYVIDLSTLYFMWLHTNCFSQRMKEAERERMNKLEQLDNKATLQFQRNLIMASHWSRALLKFRGKLKGSELDPENSHPIVFSEFWSLLNSNSVQFMEYSNFGQTISGKWSH